MEEKVKIGSILKIKNMKGEPQYTGKEGTVTHIDDIGQLHGTWGGCALIPGEDEFEVVGENFEVVLDDAVSRWLEDEEL